MTAVLARALSAATSRDDIPERITWAVGQLRPAPRGRVLEVGCGNGAALALLAHRTPGRTIIGIDRSAVQVRRANERLRDLPEHMRPQIQVMTLDAAARHYGAEPFDTVDAVCQTHFHRTSGRCMILTRAGRRR